MAQVADAPEVRLRSAREPVPGKIVAAIAAALAGFLEAEALSGRAFRIVDVRRYGASEAVPPLAPVAPWGLAGRLDLMAGRASTYGRRGAGCR
ncbi:MAG: hypothetical protein QME70_12625 [Bacillota bacterium]|nr:hypothetical protein [Bacillota bacterium]